MEGYGHNGHRVTAAWEMGAVEAGENGRGRHLLAVGGATERGWQLFADDKRGILLERGKIWKGVVLGKVSSSIWKEKSNFWQMFISYIFVKCV